MPRFFRFLSFALLFALLLTGCLVRSVEPWLTTKDLVFEDDLLGGWTGTKDDGSEVAMTFIRDETAPLYVVQYAQKDGQGTFEARLAKAGAHYFLDVRPRTETQGIDGLLLFRSHSVARLEITATRITLYPLDYGAIKAEAKLDRLRGLQFTLDADDELVFTSKSEDLQRFLFSLSRDSKLFAPPIRLTRRR